MIYSSHLSFVIRHLVKKMNLKDLEIYRLSLELSQIIWTVVSRWDNLAQKTVGVQLIRAADSIGANIAEGFGRFHFKDNKLFCYYARGSLEEVKHWLRLAHQRNLLDESEVDNILPLVEKLPPKLNAYIKTIGKRESSSISSIRESGTND